MFSFGQYIQQELKGSSKLQVQFGMGHNFDCRKYLLIDASVETIHTVYVARIYEANVVIVLKSGYLDDIKNIVAMYEQLNPTEPEVMIVIPG